MSLLEVGSPTLCRAATVDPPRRITLPQHRRRRQPYDWRLRVLGVLPGVVFPPRAFVISRPSFRARFTGGASHRSAKAWRFRCSGNSRSRPRGLRASLRASVDSSAEWPRRSCRGRDKTPRPKLPRARLSTSAVGNNSASSLPLARLKRQLLPPPCAMDLFEAQRAPKLSTEARRASQGTAREVAARD